MGPDRAAGVEAEFPRALTELETAVFDACAEREEWPERIAAGVCAAIDFIVENPDTARVLAFGTGEESEYRRRYGQIIGRFSGFLRVSAPPRPNLPLLADEALVGGVVRLVSDHVRLDRLDRLVSLRAELVLLTLLPYLGFAEAQRWANWASPDP